MVRARGPGGRRKPAAKPPRPAGAKAQRLEAARQGRRKTALRRRGLVALMVVLVAGVVVAALANSAADRREESRLNDLLTAGECTVDRRTDSGSDHVPSPEYEVDPPAGGDHTPQAADPGIYEPGQAPPDGPLVHAMEHGYVILWYRPGVDDETAVGVQGMAERFGDATLVVPRPSLEVPVAATAWHRRLLCPGGFEERPFVEFVKAYRDKGPEKGFIQ